MGAARTPPVRMLAPCYARAMSPERSSSVAARGAPRLAVLGAGAWGSVLASLLAERGAHVTLWARDPETAKAWHDDRVDPKGRVPLRLPDGVKPTADLDAALHRVDGVFLAVPNAGLDGLLDRIARPLASGPVIVSCSKGLFAPDLSRPSDHVERVIPATRVAVLSGPNLAGEIAAGLPAAATVASRYDDVAHEVQGWLTSERFRVYTSSDPVGVEVAGAYKNVIALAAGMCDALALGENTKAALITRGLAETIRLGRHLGGRERTFYGLAGVGDLVATCASGASRNHTAGERLAQGVSIDEVRASGLTAEGIATAEAVDAYARAHGLSLPIAEQVAAVVAAGRSAGDALAYLLSRDPREE